MPPRLPHKGERLHPGVGSVAAPPPAPAVPAAPRPRPAGAPAPAAAGGAPRPGTVTRPPGSTIVRPVGSGNDPRSDQAGVGPTAGPEEGGRVWENPEDPPTTIPSIIIAATPKN